MGRAKVDPKIETTVLGVRLYLTEVQHLRDAARAADRSVSAEARHRLKNTMNLSARDAAAAPERDRGKK